jgi:hypothetical protein
VSEAKPHPYKFDEFKGAPYRRRATLRYRLRSGKAFSMDHFLYGLPLVVIDDLDKLDLEIVGKVYRNNINALFQLQFRIIYTIPMAATRDLSLL